jgi:hypothetical protein
VHRLHAGAQLWRVLEQKLELPALQRQQGARHEGADAGRSRHRAQEGDFAEVVAVLPDPDPPLRSVGRRHQDFDRTAHRDSETVAFVASSRTRADEGHFIGTPVSDHLVFAGQVVVVFDDFALHLLGGTVLMRGVHRAVEDGEEGVDILTKVLQEVGQFLVLLGRFFFDEFGRDLDVLGEAHRVPEAVRGLEESLDRHHLSPVAECSDRAATDMRRPIPAAPSPPPTH